jgi:hypothetical protein
VINITATGGTGSYTYNWGNSVTSEDRTGLVADTYTVTVTDGNMCQATATATITQPDALSVTTPTNATAAGGPCTFTTAAVQDQFNTWLGGFLVAGGVGPETSVSYAVTDAATNTTSTPNVATAPPVDGGVTVVTWTVTDDCGASSTTTASFTVSNCMRISGEILEYRDLTAVAGVSVGMPPNSAVLSNAMGEYSQFVTASGGNHTVTPSKTLFTAPFPKSATVLSNEGINAFDVQAITAHIGGGAALTNPYQLIAANVVLGTSGSQSNNRLTNTDATVLSQAINGNSSAQQTRLRWRFVPASLDLTSAIEDDNGDPRPRFWGLVPTSLIGNQNGLQYNTYTENLVFINLDKPFVDQDFVAVKVGDVVPNPPAFTDHSSTLRYNGLPLVWEVEDRKLRTGESIDVTFSAEQMQDLLGWQFGLNFDPTKLAVKNLATSQAMPLDPDVNFGLYQADQGEIRSLWADFKPTTLAKGARVFTLTFDVLNGGSLLSEVLGLDDEVLEGFAIHETKEPVNVMLSFRGTDAVAYGQPVLHQNVPNPFSQETRVRFELPIASDIQLTVHDVNGRMVKEINGFYSAGLHEVRFGRGEFGGFAGVMYYTLRCGDFVATKRMVVIE